MTSPLRNARIARSLTLKHVSSVVSTDPSNLARIELGTQLPNRRIARSLYEFYDGAVPLGGIYDPVFFESHSVQA